MEGARTPLLGLRVLWIHPSLWAYAVLPLLLNLLITAAILAMLFGVALALTTWIHPSLSQWTGAWWYVGLGLEILAVLVIVIICIAIAMLVWRLMTGVLCGYFYGLLATQVEEALGVDVSKFETLTMVREIGDTMRDFFWLLVVMMISLALSLIPFVGPPLALVYGLYYQFLACGREYLSYPMALRGMTREQRLEFTNQRHYHTMGLGAVVFAFEFIPIVGALILVTAVAGGVVVHQRLLDEEQQSEN